MLTEKSEVARELRRRASSGMYFPSRSFESSLDHDVDWEGLTPEEFARIYAEALAQRAMSRKGMKRQERS